MADLSPAVLLALLRRDNHRCVRCGEIPDTPAGWTAYRRKAGDDSPASLVVLCVGPTGCVAEVEDSRAEAYMLGLIVPPTVDPRRVPVCMDRASRWTYLTDDWRYADDPPPLLVAAA